jgi:hypothetical protein
MIKLITSFFLILSTTLIYSQEKITDQINIPFTLSEHGYIIIPVTINGIEGKYVFDTGAGINLLFKKSADKIKDLEKTEHFYTGHRATGEGLEIDLWKTKSLEIQDFKVDNEIFGILDIDFELDGLISLAMFKDKQITIDFKNKILSIESKKSLKKLLKNEDFEIPIQISNDRDISIDISMKVILDNKLSLDVVLDSGAGYDVYRFNSRFMKSLEIDSAQVKKIYKPSYFKPGSGNNFFITEVSEFSDASKNVSEKNFRAIFIEGLIYEGIMSINWIGEKITIDIPNKRLIVKK